jgi:hypothetical protein
LIVVLMEKKELEQWFKDGRAQALQLLNLPADWWPTTQGDEQAKASAWALAFFLLAAKDRCSAPKLMAACSASQATKPLNATVLQALWSAAGTRDHQEEQVLVDFSVHNWDASNPIQITGESETNAQQLVDDQLTANSYGWDFYKLLLVPSSTRLFFARVGGDGGLSAADRCDRLAQTLIGLVDWYGPALLRPHDELGAIIIPSAKGERQRSLVLWLDRGRLRKAPIDNACLP